MVIEIIGLMSEADPRGSLLINGKQPTDQQLAAVCGVPVSEVSAAMAELRDAGVFRVDPDGTIYSRRMRCDDQATNTARANGAHGGNPYLRAARQDKEQRVNPLVNPLDNGGVNPKNKEDRGETLEREKTARHIAPLDPDARKRALFAFDRFWSAWPNKVGKPAAERALAKVADEIEAILAGVAAYVRDKPPDRPWLNPATFLNQRRWEDAPASTNTPSRRLTGRPTSARESNAQFVSEMLGTSNEPANEPAWPDDGSPIIDLAAREV
jgi:hypothetical protein